MFKKVDWIYYYPDKQLARLEYFPSLEWTKVHDVLVVEADVNIAKASGDKHGMVEIDFIKPTVCEIRDVLGGEKKVISCLKWMQEIEVGD